MRGEPIKQLARECGFELAGIAPALPLPEADFYRAWVEAGMAGRMSYLGGDRGEKRSDPRSLLASARSIICVGKLYNGPQPYSTALQDDELAWIARYAWGDDYHAVLHVGLEQLAAKLKRFVPAAFEWKACVDTAPLLERAYAHRAGLGWIGKNTCLISQQSGSWFFLGELLVSFEIEPDMPPPDRCGSCTRCIDACPTRALVPVHSLSGPAYALDSRLCISYFTIELRGAIPEEQRGQIGRHVFGCDICQDVCPWNRRAPVTTEPAFAARNYAPPLEKLSALTEREFRELFHSTPVLRPRYTGFLRNVVVAMANSGSSKFIAPLEKLSQHSDEVVAEHAKWALSRIKY